MLIATPMRRAAVLFLTLSSLSAAAHAEVFAERFAAAIEGAHGADAWHAQEAFQAEIAVSFGGNQVLAGTLITDTAIGGVRIVAGDGTVLVWDGAEAWVSPAGAAFQGARFHLLTWPYFLAAPYKLRDPGSHLADLGATPYRDGATMPAARLTFEAGVGDTPDDWYVVYRDPASERLAAMAYIVTYGKDLATAEGDPHAITYDGFETVGGVPIPTRWTFWSWSAETGIHGEPIGAVTLTDPRFIAAPEDAFTRPADARADALPGS